MNAAALPPTGPLTSERLVAANGKVKDHDAWAASRALLIRELGPPTREAGFTNYWGVTTADSCTLLSIEANGDVVSDVTTAVAYPRSSTQEFEDCFARQDRTPTDKDPSAAGPVAGKVYSVHEVLEGMLGARSKWVGQTIRVSGRVRSVVRSGPAKDSTLASVSLADEKDASKTVGVQVKQNVKAAPQDGQHVIVTAEGVVAAHGRSLDDARIVR